MFLKLMQENCAHTYTGGWKWAWRPADAFGSARMEKCLRAPRDGLAAGALGELLQPWPSPRAGYFSC